MKLCQINGLTGTIPPDHRALAYGDGVFETIRINKGQAEFLDLHLERMFQGAQSLRLNVSR
jgi:4-amino-4-deoxychorismate lyase